MGAVANSQELKGLQTQLSKAKADIEVLNSELSGVKNRLLVATQRRDELDRRIMAIQAESATPVVTEHAMLRWLERVEGVNLEDLKAKILDGNTITAIKFAGSGKVSRNGHQIIFKNNTVVTVE